MRTKIVAIFAIKSILLMLSMCIFIASLILCGCEEGEDIYDPFAGYRDNSSNGNTGSGTNTLITPTFTPTGGTYQSFQDVILTINPDTATIIYTTDGNPPQANSDCTAKAGTSSIAVASNTTITIAQNSNLQAIACQIGYVNSYLKSENYIISKRIYITTDSYTGNLSDIATADGYCNITTPTTRVYKAMIVTENLTSNRKGSVPQEDWVLKPLTDYYKSDGISYIGKTNANSQFNFNELFSSFGSTGDSYWTGLLTNWNTSTDNCSDWTSDTDNGTYGEGDAVHAGAVVSGTELCSVQKKLLCVEQ